MVFNLVFGDSSQTVSSPLLDDLGCRFLPGLVLLHSQHSFGPYANCGASGIFTVVSIEFSIVQTIFVVAIVVVSSSSLPLFI